MSEDPAALGNSPHSQRSVTVGKYPKIYLPVKFRLLITGIALIPVVMVAWLIPGPSRTWPLNSRHPSSW